MDEEQQKKFEEWYANAGTLWVFSLKNVCSTVWQACVEANEVEEQELGRTASISEWSERIRERWNNVQGWSWEGILAWMLEKGFRFPEEQEPSPTEMLRKLIDKEWRIEPTSCRDGGLYALIDPNDRMHGCLCHEIKSAYRRAFPPKKKVEVEVWLDSDGEIRVIPSNSDSKGLDPKRVSWGWTKGTATFWVEEE
jgi:hypothetical protein